LFDEESEDERKNFEAADMTPVGLERGSVQKLRSRTNSNVNTPLSARSTRTSQRKLDKGNQTNPE
jgi:hypothetical protein